MAYRKRYSSRRRGSAGRRKSYRRVIVGRGGIRL